MLIDISRLAAFAAAFKAHLPEIKRVVEYLAHYGYIKPDALTLGMSVADAVKQVKEAIVKFRERSGIGTPAVDGAGLIDVAVLEKMSQPRCGFSDAAREMIAEAKWRKKALTYFIAAYVNGLSQADQEAIIRQAWDQWQAVADIKLTKATSQQTADIVIMTGRGAGQGFDGPSGTLAYAYLPTGDDRQLIMRFDLDETWVIGNPQGGILLLNVACHEFGHLLGLEHSTKSQALMAPFYAVGISKPQTVDDIPRIQALYGAATAPPPTSPPPTTPAPTPAGTTITLEVVGKQARILNVT